MCVGLVESSSVVLVASMLISPLMGPILAGVFGTVIKDNKLRLKSKVLFFIIDISHRKSFQVLDAISTYGKYRVMGIELGFTLTIICLNNSEKEYFS